MLPRIASDNLVSASIYDNAAAIGGMRVPFYSTCSAVTGHLRECVLYETRNPHWLLRHDSEAYGKHVQYMILIISSLEDEIAGTKMMVQVMSEHMRYQ